MSEPAPISVGGRGRSPLLERDADLAALRALLDAARDGNGRLAAIEGSAGIGKTRLLAEARAIAAEMGLRILAARGGELEQGFAFGIVRQLFEPRLATASEVERAELLAGAAGLAAPLFGESDLAEAPTSGDVPFALLHGLYWLAANAALAQPTMLVVDDLHWADAPSMRWLGDRARRLEGLPLMLVVGTRPPRQAEQAALLTDLLSDPAAVVLRPVGLGLDSVAILARDVFSAEPDAEFCAACHDATGGNPLYLRALLATLAGEGLAPSADSSGRVREVGPEPVARAVSLRLSRLAPEASTLAHAIAVLGQSAELGRAAALAGIDRSAAATVAAALARAELLRLEPVLEFTHPVVRAAVYEAIGPVERAEAHRHAAALLAEAGLEPEWAAAHLVLVPPAGDASAVDVLCAAARRGLERGAAETTVAYLRRALAEPPSAEQRPDVLFELGTLEEGFDLPSAIEHLREALELAEGPGRTAQVGLELGRALLHTTETPFQALDVLRDAAEGLGPEERDQRELLEAEIVSASWMDPEHYPMAKQFVEGFREEEFGGGFGTDVLLATLAHFEQRRGTDRPRASRLAKRAIESGRMEHATGLALFYAADALRATGEVDDGIAFYDRALGAARRRGDLLNVAGLLSFRGALLTDRGDLRTAEPDLRDGLEFSVQYGLPGHVMYCASLLADLLLEQGRLDETETVLARTGLPEQLPDGVHFIYFLDARGMLRLAQRKAEQALDDFLALGRIADGLEIENPAYRPWRSHAAAALHTLGRTDEALELAGAGVELARRWGAPRWIGISLRALAPIEGGRMGEERLREAIDVLALSPARLEHARALVELGSSLRRRNERSRARELLREGVEVAHRCGATALVERGNEELAATGARPRKILVTGIDSLTASERRVAQLAADEMTNKDIAQTLFVTVKTVEVHLSHVYRKLEIASRRQLAAALVGPQPEPVAAPV